MAGAARIAIVAGSTGLVGAHLLSLLDAATDYARIIALARRPIAVRSPRVERRSAEFDRLDAVLGDLNEMGSCLDVFCCLGTTLRLAGSHEAFRRVDHDHVLALAHWAKGADARRLLTVSALGANAQSRAFYSRVKGETEQALRLLGLRSLVVARPSLLAGERHETRLGERLALLATRPLRAVIPAAVRPIAAEDVAAALLLAARDESPPSILDNAQMLGAASRLAPPR